MDIRPIAAIRPITPASPVSGPDLLGIFGAEFRRQGGNHPPPQQPERGLEDEEDESLFEAEDDTLPTTSFRSIA